MIFKISVLYTIVKAVPADGLFSKSQFIGNNVK